MRIAGVLYIIASLLVNFVVGTTETMFYALPSFPIAVWLLTTKSKNINPSTPQQTAGKHPAANFNNDKN